MSHTRSFRGFTLIELLVVIAIIGVLAGLLFAGITRARFAAHLAKCKSSQRQIGQALYLYAGDFDGLLADSGTSPFPFPTNQMWVGAAQAPVGLGLLYPKYLRNAACFYCPTDKNNRPSEALENMDPDSPDGDDVYSSYIYRRHSVGSGSWQVNSPGLNPDDKAIHALTVEVNVQAYQHIVHNEKMVTMLFADGSVRALPNVDGMWTMTGDMASLLNQIQQAFIRADSEY